MSLAITLPTELEVFLNDRANLLGVPVETLVSQVLEERWGIASNAPHLSQPESELLARLQALFPPDQTREYRSLCKKSDDGVMTEEERKRLLALLEERDLQNAERLEILAQLARIRGVSLREIMAQLEIRPD